MTAIGIPPRTPDEWDVPPARPPADMVTLVERQRQQRADAIERQLTELRAHARRHLAERGQAPSPERWVDWHEFLDIDPDLRGRDYARTGGAR